MNVLLRLPSIEEVAELLVQRDKVDRDLAIRSARQAQSHVGMARRLAVSQDARSRRAETLREIAGITNLSRAMLAAENYWASPNAMLRRWLKSAISPKRIT